MKLSESIEAMRRGSKSGFLSFYDGTVQFIYNQAIFLYKDKATAISFMEDFYQYLYLHINDYRRGDDINKWISKELLNRYRQLSTGRDRNEVDLRNRPASGISMDDVDVTLLRKRLLGKIHFPPEAKRFGVLPVLAVIVVLSGIIILSLILFHEREQENKTDASILDGVVSGSGIASQGAIEEVDPTKETENIIDEINNLSNVTTEESSVEHNESTDGETEKITEETVKEPQVEAPKEPIIEAPTVNAPEQTQMGNNKDKSFAEKVEELDNLELEMTTID